MNFLDVIKPHLVSHDILVQETVLHALHDYPNVPEEWIVELLKEAFTDKEKLTSILIYVLNQKINEEALRILLHYIPEMELQKRHLAIRLLEQVDVELAIRYKEQLERYLPKETWELYDLIENGTEEDVYSKYGELLNTIEDAKSFRHDLFIQAKKLAECIVKKGWIEEFEIDIVLSEELEEDWFSINGILHVYMIGLLKKEKYIPILVSLLERDEDILLEEVASALIQFQSDEVVKEVAPYLKKQESVIFATSVVENIKTDLAVQKLIEAYHEQEEIDDQDLIIEALCHHFLSDALKVISTHMENEYTSLLVDIEQVAYGYFTILGEKHPELELWKQEALRRERDFRNDKTRSLQGNVPVKNENKVGRNDPCPCGSGKKYKKCCG